ncbi:DUF4268 domain-containing protein [Gluconacetobacter sp. 1b LMG 1731]|uniref:DUF4268 domain-containing protein n=1 Tax=Gluconacetobacter dulcium TaxID=2729096 RepID=A0A7W4INV9_9PROT|nr:DUF4268 domain-containing protein [Gluconacetobacter dulcium]MBB2166314.1 DUF4268 domain-containing protein [Gluconacetobacter dulcium]MBB2195426.1 DUF4268 domain-containing protein [Gluconacetobacter dulcium]
MRLGHIETVEVRTIWQNEASHFTPWLAKAENLIALGKVLHLGELRLEATEVSVGDFSADIVAVDENDTPVLIENQLELTDHRHLGQVITYLSGINNDEANIIWISTRFREEHRAAIEWLNRNTIDGFDFFGIEIEVLRIGESDPAPRFNVVAMPNDWAKQARQTARRISSEATGSTGLLYQEFWISLQAAYEKLGNIRRFPKTWPRQWLPFSIGRGGFKIVVTIARATNEIRVELYMHQKNMPPNQAYNALYAQRDSVERDFGTTLDWQPLPDRCAARIAVSLPNSSITDKDNWPRQQEWILTEITKFRKVFTERVKQIDLDENIEIPENESDINLTSESN